MSSDTNPLAAELERLQALEALDTRVNARKREAATPGASPEARQLTRARAAEFLSRWALPVGGALVLSGLWLVVRGASVSATLGLLVGVGAHCAVVYFIQRRKLS